MTDTQAAELFNQVLLMHEEWAASPMNTEGFARLVNGLFSIASEIDGSAMMLAFDRGAKRASRSLQSR